MTSVDDIVRAIEALRSVEHPEIESSLVESIIQVEAEGLADRVAARRQVGRVAEAHLDRVGD